MIHRYPVALTTMEEDFKKIGLIPEDELTESDNSENPRDIPSPDPSALAGNDDSGMGGHPGRHATGSQPRPKMKPDEKDDHDDPDDAGATQKKGKNAGSYNKKPNYRESVDGNRNPDDGHYKVLAKRPGMERADDKGKDPDKAQGLKPTKKIAGMKEGSAVSRAAELMGEVDALLRGAQADEQLEEFRRGFYLIGENAALLADRLIEISEEYDVEEVVVALQEMMENAVEALDIVDQTEYQANEGIDDGMSLDDIGEAFTAMTMDLMEAIQAYDAVLDDIAEAYEGDDDEDDDDDEEDDDEDEDKGKKEESLGIAERLERLRELRAGK